MEIGFERHDPCRERVLFVLTLDRKKMKERIVSGIEYEVRSRLRGEQSADVLVDVTRPLGTFLAEFEHDPDGEWNRFGLAPLREALHSNRWKQPDLEKAAGDFLRKKFDSGDPLRMYVAYRIWDEYLRAREKRDRPAACDWFMDRAAHFTMAFLQRSPLQFDSDTGRPQPFSITSRVFGSVPSDDTRLDLWFPDNKRRTESVSAYNSLYPLITYYLNRLNDWGCAFESVKSAGVSSLRKASGMSCAATSAGRSRRSKTSGSLTRGQGKITTICSIKMSARTGATRSIRRRKQRASPLTGWKKC